MCGGNFVRLLTPLTTISVEQTVRFRGARTAIQQVPCPTCGTAITPEFAWCPKCGSPLKSHPCVYCGQTVNPGDKTCSFCGGPPNNG